MKPRLLDRIETLANRYRCFVFDQYGVLHDGERAYEGMASTLDALKAAGAMTAVLTNSGRRATPNAERLARFGFGPARIDHVVSSGELAYRLLAGEIGAAATAHTGKTTGRGESLGGSTRRDDAWALNGDSRVLLIARGADRSALDGLPGHPTDDPRAATHVLITGSDGEHRPLDEYRALLEPAARRGVPALCTNPDRWMLVGRDRRCFAAGQIAQAYRESGGEVLYIGKPWPAIYRFVLSETGVPPEQTVCIGDSIEHDISGAVNAGLASVLVTTGVHAGADTAERTTLYERYRAPPDFLLVE